MTNPAGKETRRLKQGNHHPGYVIGQHWMAWAYARICAGESEDSVMRDFGYVPEPSPVEPAGVKAAE